MHISKLYLKGYKNTAEESTIVFNRGLNVLLGKMVAEKQLLLMRSDFSLENRTLIILSQLKIFIVPLTR